jgi:hypothetical protein
MARKPNEAMGIGRLKSKVKKASRVEYTRITLYPAPREILAQRYPDKMVIRHLAFYKNF